MIATENWDALDWKYVRRGVERKVILTAATRIPESIRVRVDRVIDQ